MSNKPSFDGFDEEFSYTPEIEANLGKMMSDIENGPRHEKTSQQTFEEYCRLHEANVKSREQYRWENQEELKSGRTGKILHMNQFLGLLKECGLNAWYTEKGGMRGTLGLYVGIKGGTEEKYIGFVQVPNMQEYEEMHFDDYNVPLGIKRRGWRTVLLKLIDAGILSVSRAHEVFGEPASGPISRRYRQYLAYVRNRDF